MSGAAAGEPEAAGTADGDRVHRAPKAPHPDQAESGRGILAFECRRWQGPGPKEHAIAETFGISATRYYQLLDELIDRPEALLANPVLVKRLRARRDSRRQLRAAIQLEGPGPAD